MNSEESKKRMAEGRLYEPCDEAIMKEQLLCMEKLYDFNQTRPSELEKRDEMLKDMFAEWGENNYIEPPLHANFGGAHCHFGNYVYANYNLTLVDDGHIYVGDNVMFAPNVVVATAGHPLDTELRRQGLQFNADVHIGSNTWIGAGALIMPGVTIGENCVIGAGSVVTKDVPAGKLAFGNPCRVQRDIGEHDKIYYFKDRKVDL